MNELLVRSMSSSDAVTKDTNKDDDKNNDKNTDANPTPPAPAIAKPITKKTAPPSNDILAKLRKILDDVAAQEADLKKNTHRIEDWYNMHKEALSISAQVKEALIKFEVINDDDSDEIKLKKKKNKATINSSLDLLEKQLRNINQNEKKYRSKECLKDINQLNIRKKEIEIKLNKMNDDYDKLNKLNLVNIDKYENQIKLLNEEHNKINENIKKELNIKYKDNINKFKDKNDKIKKELNNKINELTNNINKLKKDHSAQIEQKVNAMKEECDITINKQKIDYELDINKLKNNIEQALKDYTNLEAALIDKEEQLNDYKKLNNEHEELRIRWTEHKKKLNNDIINLKQLKDELNNKMDDIQDNNQILQANAAKHAIQITQNGKKYDDIKEKYIELNNNYNKIIAENKKMKTEKSALIKEVKKLRNEIKDKDGYKSSLLLKMSNDESVFNKKIENFNNKISELNVNIVSINLEHISQFKLLNNNLNNVHSKIESFAETIKNFSGNSLKHNYSTKLQAIHKSNQELPIFQENIRNQIKKALKNTLNDKLKAKDDKKSNNRNNNNSKFKLVINESDRQIAHIKLTCFQLLMEYTSLMIEYNNLYIAYAKSKPIVNNNGQHSRMQNAIVIQNSNKSKNIKRRKSVM